jgi:hypothetical protein
MTTATHPAGSRSTPRGPFLAALDYDRLDLAGTESYSKVLANFNERGTL